MKIKVNDFMFYYKVLLIDILVFISSLSSYSNGIDSLKIIPSNPTNIDSIKLISYCTFSGNVQYDTSVISNNDSLVYVYSYYTELFPYIDSQTTRVDTISIGKLDAGVYKIIQYTHLRIQNPDTITYTNYNVIDSDTIEFIILYVESVNCNNNIIIVFPNPAGETVNIIYKLPENTQNAVLDIFNIIGDKIINYKINDKQGTFILDTSDLPDGLYFYTIKVNNNIIARNKIIIVK